MTTQRHSEKGAALVIAVCVLIVLTIVGLAAVTSSNLGSDIAGTLRSKSAAYHMAEACMNAQISRIKAYGAATTRLDCGVGYTNDLDATGNATCDMGTGYTCSADQPTVTGGSGGTAGTMDGFSLESGSSKIATIPYAFNVTGTGPRGTQSTLVVRVNIAAGGGGY